ncbi:UNVERIFIED_CONTAM: DNA-binding CsgD family transcriptional regulator [Streptomyces canus]|jgi:DNA-binding CsgD family transcriptional regulator
MRGHDRLEGGGVTGLPALSGAEIMERPVVAEPMIRAQVSRMLVKPGLRGRTQAAVFAYEARLVRPNGR